MASARHQDLFIADLSIAAITDAGIYVTDRAKAWRASGLSLERHVGW
jgi:hypothetical protein